MNNRYRAQQEAFNSGYQMGPQLRRQNGYLWADTPDAHFVSLFSSVQPHLESDATCLDIGCGDGRHTLFLAETGLSVIGIDYSESAIEHATELAIRRSVTKARFVMGDALQLESIDRTFDLVLQWSVMSHYYPDDHQRAVVQIAGVTNPGGLMILSEPSIQDSRRSSFNAKFVELEGCLLYFFDTNEIHDLFTPYFDVIHHAEALVPQVHDPDEIRCVHQMILVRRASA